MATFADDSTSGPAHFTVPNYAFLSNNFDKIGALKKSGPLAEYDDNIHVTYIRANQKDSLKNNNQLVDLENIVTTAKITTQTEMIPGAATEQEGGLYFSFGYDKFKSSDVVQAADRQNVDINKIAQTLIQNPKFQLQLTAHTDTAGGDAQNQKLSENRLATAEDLIIQALQKQGLKPDDALKLYDERVAPNTKFIADGEKSGPVTTADGVKEQANRVVSFDLITHAPPVQKTTLNIVKGADEDNHEHMVVLALGPTNYDTQTDLKVQDFSPPKPGQMTIPDENTAYVIKIDPESQSHGEPLYYQVSRV